MLVNAFLRWLVVIGHNAEHRTEIVSIKRFKLLDNGSGIVASATYDKRNPSGNPLSYEPFKLIFLFGA